MDSKDIRNLQEAYLSVYNSEPEYISEEVEIATEYFYEMGLNEEGINILIEELGDQEFSEWVYDIAEEYTLTEARAGGVRVEPVTKSGKSIGTLKGGAKTAAIRARQKEKAARRAAEAESSSAKPSGMTAALRSQAAKSAASKQTPKSSTPTETKKGIGGLIGGAVNAYNKGMQRHRQVTQTASDLASKTGEAANKLTKGLIQSWQNVADDNLGKATRVQIKKGLKRQQKAIDTLAPRIGAAAGRGLGNLVKGLRRKEYDYVLEYLLDEGYASNFESAEKIMMNMSEQWLESIVEELLDESDIMSVHRKPSKTDKGGMVYMKNPNIVRLQNAAARERQGRQEKEKELKNRENAARYDQALKKGINRATNRSEPQDQYAGYGEIEALSPRADGGAHSGRKRLARRASGR